MMRLSARQIGLWGVTILTPMAIGLSAGCEPIVVEEQSPPPAPPGYYQAPAPVAPADVALQQLVAPVALYPDPLLAVVLPASTYPDEIQQAAYWLQMNGNAPDYVIAQQPWDASIQALVHYPSVLQYMAGDIQWTSSLGSAFSYNQRAVMDAIQELRAQAYSCGSLQSSAQMDVIEDGSYIYIQPTNPDVICVPSYDAVYVYQRPEPLSFGATYGVGVWLGFAFDWNSRSFYRGDWHEGWQQQSGGWHRTPGWQAPQAQVWQRDGAHGPPPNIQPNRYVPPQQIRGHQQEFRPAPPVKVAPKPIPDAAHRTDLPPQSDGRQQPVPAAQPVYHAAPQQNPQQQYSGPEHGTPDQNHPGMPVQNPQEQNPGQQHVTADQNHPGAPVQNPQHTPEPKGPAQPASPEKKPAPGPQDKSKSPPKPGEKPADDKKPAPDDQNKDQGQGQNQDQSKMPQK
jgi:hypothetical protein